MKTDLTPAEIDEKVQQGCGHKNARGSRCGKKVTHAVVWQNSGMTLFRCKRHTYHVEGQAHSEEL